MLVAPGMFPALSRYSDPGDRAVEVWEGLGRRHRGRRNPIRDQSERG